MNKPETIEAAKAAGVVRTDAQFEAMNKGAIAALTEEYSKMTPEQKEAANKAAEVETSAPASEENKAGENSAPGSEENKPGEEAAKGAGEETKKPAKVSDKLKKDLADVFTSYPETKELFSTTDGTVFFKKHDAANHQISLTKKVSDVSAHKR